MKENKLKFLSLAAFCLVSVLWSEARGMENRSDILGSETVKASASMQKSTQNERDDFTSESTSSLLVNLEDSQESWSSYMLSLAENVIGNNYGVFGFSVPSLGRAGLIGLLLSTQVVAIGAMTFYQCVCLAPNGEYYPNGVMDNCTNCDPGCRTLGGSARQYQCTPFQV